jgi:hypothetical protein
MVLSYIYIIEKAYSGKKIFCLLGKGYNELKKALKYEFNAKIKKYAYNKIINKSLSHDEFIDLLRKSESSVGCTGDQSFFEVINTNHVSLYEALSHKFCLVGQQNELCEQILRKILLTNYY